MKTESQIRATENWERQNYDKVLLRLKKGTKDKIKATGKSVNGFIVEAVERALSEIEKD